MADLFHLKDAPSGALAVGIWMDWLRTRSRSGSAPFLRMRQDQGVFP